MSNGCDVENATQAVGEISPLDLSVEARFVGGDFHVPHGTLFASILSQGLKRK